MQIKHLHRMHSNRISKVMLHYRPNENTTPSPKICNENSMVSTKYLSNLLTECRNNSIPKCSRKMFFFFNMSELITYEFRRDVTNEGLMVGARETIPTFFAKSCKQLGISNNVIYNIDRSEIRGSTAILQHHLYSPKIMIQNSPLNLQDKSCHDTTARLPRANDIHISHRDISYGLSTAEDKVVISMNKHLYKMGSGDENPLVLLCAEGSSLIEEYIFFLLMLSDSDFMNTTAKENLSFMGQTERITISNLSPRIPIGIYGPELYFISPPILELQGEESEKKRDIFEKYVL
ncbi:hypothetical protein C0J52_23283 [Blattella germanica]|nr:hypothetical protein C0J52_23283 [Blattella germanica]